MKNKKGVTLVSLVLYCSIMLLIIGVVTVIRVNVDRNMDTVQQLKGYVTEINKLSMYMITETKDTTNGIKKVAGDGSSIEFKNGNRYVFENNKIYKITVDNKTIAICNDILDCEFKYDTENRKEIVKATIQVLSDEVMTKTMEYVFK